MDIIWKIVNFIILFGALYLICRKMNLFDKMFGSRRRGIGEEIENSEKPRLRPKPSERISKKPEPKTKSASSSFSRMPRPRPKPTERQ